MVISALDGTHEVLEQGRHRCLRDGHCVEAVHAADLGLDRKVQGVGLAVGALGARSGADGDGDWSVPNLERPGRAIMASMSRGAAIATLLGTVLGVALGVFSGVLAHFSESWWIDVSLGLSVTLLLFVPLYFFGRMLDRHVAAARSEIGQVREDAESLRVTVADLEESVGLQLDEVHAIVERRLLEERGIDEDALRVLSERPSREALKAAIARAEALHLIDPRHPPRVGVSAHEYLYLQVAIPTGEEQWKGGREDLELELVGIDGLVVATIAWPVGQSTEDVMTHVGRELYTRTREALDSRTFFAGLSQLLRVGLAMPSSCPVVQLVQPQWVITARGVMLPYDRPRGYSVSAPHLRADRGFESHVKSKTWVDPDCFDEAVHVLLELFPESPERVGF